MTTQSMLAPPRRPAPPIRDVARIRPFPATCPDCLKQMRRRPRTLVVFLTAGDCPEGSPFAPFCSQHGHAKEGELVDLAGEAIWHTFDRATTGSSLNALLIGIWADVMYAASIEFRDARGATLRDWRIATIKAVRAKVAELEAEVDDPDVYKLAAWPLASSAFRSSVGFLACVPA